MLIRFEATDSSNERMMQRVPIFEWKTTMLKDSCPSIDDDTDTDFPGANNNEESRLSLYWW